MKQFTKAKNVISVSTMLMESARDRSPVAAGAAGGDGSLLLSPASKRERLPEDGVDITITGAASMRSAAMSLTASSLVRMSSGRRSQAVPMTGARSFNNSSGWSLTSPNSWGANFHGSSGGNDESETSLNLISVRMRPSRPLTSRYKTQLRRSGQAPATQQTHL